MLGYIGSEILRDKVHVREGGSNWYDHVSNVRSVDDFDTEPHVIVHEATHAVIDATNPGLIITKGSGEAAAYLA
jgi:hypothetical protein